jgi:hypothetical protein
MYRDVIIKTCTYIRKRETERERNRIYASAIDVGDERKD